MSEKPIRVLLADDHPIVRAGIRAELENLSGVQVVAEAADGREARELALQHQPDVVFMDISMGGLNGLEATARITRENPKARIIILSMHQNEEYYWQALKAGAAGYLLKKAATTELRAALDRVMAGEIYLSRDISHRLINSFAKARETTDLPLEQFGRDQSRLGQLTERQREILQLIAEGQTTKAIAIILKVSPKTVEYHRAKLMERLNIFDIPGLVRLALREKLISSDT